MQKLLRRHLLAKAQQARKLKRAKEVEERLLNSSLRRQLKMMNQEQRDLRLAERTARREDWDMGPLAPRRDVGEDGDFYGGMNSRWMRGIQSISHGFVKIRDFRVGDRVVLTDGPDQGNIGEIKEIMEDRNLCFVEGLNMVQLFNKYQTY
jgi:large subunit ribosomal protein L24